LYNILFIGHTRLGLTRNNILLITQILQSALIIVIFSNTPFKIYICYNISFHNLLLL